MTDLGLPKAVREIDRILALPVVTGRGASDPRRYTLPGSDARLFPVQSIALEEIQRKGSAILTIGVGHGKTLISMLANKALGAPPERAIVLVPSGTKAEFFREFEKWQKHFDIDPVEGRVFTYDDISRRYGILDQIRPTHIISDEIHNLKDSKASRTRQFIRYFRENPETRFVGMTGSITTKSLRDFSHLAEIALRDGSPLPIRHTDLESWCAVIDPVTASERAPNAVDFARTGPLLSWAEETDHRKAFFKRFSTAPGVVHTEEPSVTTPLFIREIRDLQIPDNVQEAIQLASTTWMLPCGQEIDDPLRMASKLRELVQGFYYRWDWPGGIPDREWLYARSDLSKAIHSIFKLGRKGLDTRTQILAAIERGEFRHWPDVVEAWDQWLAVRDRPEPPVEVVWFSDYLIHDALERVRRSPRPCLLWYSARAVAERIAETGKIFVAKPGEDPLQYAGSSVAVSIASHGTGLNLQAWNRAIVLSPPSSAGRWEQLIGRIHRNGQTATACAFEVYTHAATGRDAMRSARKGAKYVEEVTGQKQKLLLADWI